jgi:hypothetical protein
MAEKLSLATDLLRLDLFPTLTQALVGAGMKVHLPWQRTPMFGFYYKAIFLSIRVTDIGVTCLWEAFNLHTLATTYVENIYTVAYIDPNLPRHLLQLGSGIRRFSKPSKTPLLRSTHPVSNRLTTETTSMRHGLWASVKTKRRKTSSCGWKNSLPTTLWHTRMAQS